MLWLIRAAGLYGMVLSVIRFGLVLAHVGDYFERSFPKDWGRLQEGMERLIENLTYPNYWFCLAGVAYVLADGALRKRRQQVQRQLRRAAMRGSRPWLKAGGIQAGRPYAVQQ
jgi:hypothetical protein